MIRPRVLITGGSGQVGFELKRQAALLGEVFSPHRHEMDLADAQAVEAWLQEWQPEILLNAAAYTAVDKAESEPELATRLNAELPAQLADYAATAGATLVHYSSDYVYPDDGEEPWREDSPTGPLNVYGQTKLAGDLAITASDCRHLILRTSWVYGAHGHNFMKTMLRLGQSKDALTIVGDQIGAPTPARLIAQVTAHALRCNIPSGIYHLAPRGFTSWHGFAVGIFERASVQGVPLTVAPEAVTPIPTAEYPTPAQRPLNSRLSVEKLESALGLHMPGWQEQLKLTLDEDLGA